MLGAVGTASLYYARLSNHAGSVDSFRLVTLCAQRMAGQLVSVLGATGYTGGLIVHELKRRGVTVLAAGRNRQKLQRLAAELGDLETLEAEVGDPASLDRLAGRSRVIINTAGPFIDYGEPVIRAAIANRAHYLDTTGEQPFMKAMLAHDAWAQQQQVAVVSAQAFEIAVADCAAAVAAQGFRDIAAVHITYVLPMHASQGTQRTMLRMLQSAGYAYVGGDWVAEAPAKRMQFVDFPAPVGRVAAASFPSAEVITIPRHLRVREVRAFMSMPWLAARAFAVTAPVIRTVLRSPVSRIATQLVGSGTGGPDEQTRSRDHFHVAIDVRGVRKGTAGHRRLLLRGRDPYGLTAVIAAYGATMMCQDDYDRCGVLAPAAAFAPQALLDHLRAFGLTYEASDGTQD
jgi:short subunit dehydrogenase-like uncharacterized protein